MAEQFRPRTPHAIMRDMIAKVISRTDLNDITIGSSLYTLLQSMAYEVSNIEARMAKVRNSFDLNVAEGADLDVRVSELPPVGIQRRERTFASGAVLKITRSDGGVGELTIPRNSMISRSSDQFSYVVSEDVIIPDGQDVALNVHIVATTPGTVGNARSGLIDSIVTMPEGVARVENIGPLTNGVDRESDSSLRNRALRYVRSLGRCQVDALTSLALNFIDTRGSTFRFANVYEDPINLGYSELIVDDGSGLRQFEVAGSMTTGTVPPGGQDFIYHQYPATEPISTNQINIIKASGGVISPPADKVVSIPERGIVHVTPGFLEEGDVWQIRNYNVFKGPIRELQREIEGSTDADGSINTGFRAAGTRVRVLPPIVREINFDVSIDVKPELEINNVKKDIKDTIEAYFAGLGIGEPLYVADLVKTIMNQNTVWSVKLYERNSSDLLENIYPGDSRTVLRATAENILYK